MPVVGSLRSRSCGSGDRAEAIGGVGRIQEMADEDDSESGRRHLARVLGLLLTRHGPLEPDVRTQVIELIDPIYPTGIYDTDRVLVEVLVALDDPSVIESTLPLIEAGRPSGDRHSLSARSSASEIWLG